MQIEIDMRPHGASSSCSPDSSARVRGNATSDDLSGAKSGESGDETPAEALAFCEAALRRLGYVNVFAFATGEFMVVARNGERVRADSLREALDEMLMRHGMQG
ncbi:hypothetical protein ACVBGC_25950 [Burkholderia stagnalis]